MDKVRSDAEISEQINELMAKPRNHIFCSCAPELMFCGVVCSITLGSDFDEMPNGDECPDCYLMWLGGYCPYCGLHWTEEDYQK